MCGIVGVVNADQGRSPDPDLLGAMCDTIIHRGPNSEGIDVAEGVGLGMRRLSIIDLAGGDQPLFNEDRSVRVVFNGEIYNYRELCKQLQARGHQLSTASDGEVIAHLWEEYGTDFVQHLNGMFGIALHDLKRRKLVLVRDRLGIKPLYYSVRSDGLVFGSEIKGILASGLVDRRLDVDGLRQFLCWEYVPAPRTLFRDISKLEPAGLLEVDLENFSVNKRVWWDVAQVDRSNSSGWSAGDWEEAVDAKIRECVTRQLVSDVPLGAFLSGGVDSSLVVAAMGEARTFSIGFDDPSYNELGWSEKVARHFNVNHTTEVIRPEALELFEYLMGFMEDPIADFSIFPTYLVSRLAKKDITVVLTGDGGDEVFGGYDTFVAQRLAQRISWIPRPLLNNLLFRFLDGIRPREKKKGLINKAKRFSEGYRMDPGLLHTRWRLFVDTALQQTLFSSNVQQTFREPVPFHIKDLLRRVPDWPEIDQCLYVDLNSYLIDNCLVKVDRMSMACSLEARVPLLDHELVELAFQMPTDLKVNGSQSKVLLKRVACRHVPSECIYRPKEGFSIPIKNWLKKEFRPLLEEYLAPSRVSEAGLFNCETIEQLKREHLDGVANHSHILWALLVFEDWRKRWAVT